MTQAPQSTAAPRSGNAGDRILLKGGTILSMDPALGDFAQGDVLIEGRKIVAVGAGLGDVGDAQIVDCSGQIVMPGFVNTHHHQFYAAQRAIISDGNLWAPWPQEDYMAVQDIMTFGRILDQNWQPLWDLGRSPYDPEDCRIAELLTSLNQINQGVTTGIDTSQCQHNPDYTEAMLDGIAQSGRRTVFAFSYGRGDDPAYEFPGAKEDPSRGLARLRATHFASDDQLVTLALNTDHFLFTGFKAEDVLLARELKVPLLQHSGPTEGAIAAGMLGPDMEFIHCTGIPGESWKAMADNGCHVSLSVPIEMQMGHGTPPIQQALDHGILPSLSSDVETNMASDMFTQMRGAFTLQRMRVHERLFAGDQDAPPLLTCRQVLEMATVAGAECAHLSHKIGSITPGKEADIILLDTRTFNAAGFHNVDGLVVTLMDTSNVRGVMVAGRFRKWNGEMLDVDLPSLITRIEQSRERIMERMRTKPLPVDGLNSAPGFTPKLFGSCCIGHRYAARP
ncbi:cytosine deaminase [Sphingobium jiangsuense]|uniref:Cytosine/adenosine deaminase-related metal-dependent hydrolase n=1 Tax=Sphingobium jiangsuense TaxID=870476 RepID=A0A7W6FN43_9SPHN|nr:amidohydrolase family protein [Sphingobium jiangsuense]MBB3924403.1 cytosine/adenosine deaminase-related metal-dependent hydrolase [Sphingobium jiangsuense]GLT00686.1 cytosine deaminase [Sphingobium jiangsuense]